MLVFANSYLQVQAAFTEQHPAVSYIGSLNDIESQRRAINQVRRADPTTNVDEQRAQMIENMRTFNKGVAEAR